MNFDLINEKLSYDYGMVIGRFQPFHFGHEHIINEIILDGKRPLILIGDDDGLDKKRNPLTPEQVKELIETIFPNECDFIILKDSDDWDIWVDNINTSIKNIGTSNDGITLYYYNKESDRYSHFSCNNKDYFNEFYTKILEDNGFKMKEIEFVERSDIHVDIDATNIRDNFCQFKHLLDGRVYWKLHNWGWEDCSKHESEEQILRRMFDGDRSYLSNMYNVPIAYRGKIYNSSEALYMSFKNDSNEWQEFVLNNHPYDIKLASRDIKLVDNWNEIRIEAMRTALILKFSQHPDLLKKLMQEKQLVEYNYWNDTFWGKDIKTNEGENNLGKLLNEVRYLLKGTL